MTTVLQLSDTHFTADGGAAYGLDPATRLATVLDAWQARGGIADLILLTGDLTDDASTNGCRLLAEMVSGFGIPVFAVAGNHDNPAAVNEVFGDAQQVEVDDWRVLGVTSIVAGEVHGQVSPDELDDRLNALDDRPTIIALHHPPTSPSQHPWFSLDNGPDIIDRLGRHAHVRGVLSGHLHMPFEEQLDGLSMLGAPSTLYSIRHVADSWHADPSVPTGARIVTLYDDGQLSSELLIA